MEMSHCERCYLIVELFPGCPQHGGCKDCQGRRTKTCGLCEAYKVGAPPCAHCYPDRLFRWAAIKTLEKGEVPNKAARGDICLECSSFTCGCGDAAYKEEIYAYLEKRGWKRPM